MLLETRTIPRPVLVDNLLGQRASNEVQRTLSVAERRGWSGTGKKMVASNEGGSTKSQHLPRRLHPVTGSCPGKLSILAANSTRWSKNAFHSYLRIGVPGALWDILRILLECFNQTIGHNRLNSEGDRRMHPFPSYPDIKIGKILKQCHSPH